MPRCVGIALLIGAFASYSRAGDWPEFRGPTGQGLYEGKPLPTEWDATKNVIWRTPIPGLGWSTPSIVAGRVYLTTAVPKDSDFSLRAICLDAESGKIIWDHEVFLEDGRNSPKPHTKNSHASPSPLLNDRKIYVHFGHQGTACLDLEGHIVWQNRELKYTPVHGTGGSPVLVDGTLIFSCDGASNPFVAGLDAATGALRWKTLRSWDAIRKFSFSTPLVITVNGQKEVVSPGSGGVAAYNPGDGHEIWKVYYEEGYSVVPRPVFGHGMIYISTAFDSPVVMAIRADAKGDATDSHVAWQLKRGAPRNASPLLVGEELYLVSDNGLASCVNAKTGKAHWQESIGGAYSASPIYADGRVYFASEKGQVTIVKAGTTFHVESKNNLDEQMLASPAAADGVLYLRTSKALYRIGQR
jgi:outer membrane protein assembly factor BamB